MGDKFNRFNSWKVLAYPEKIKKILTGKFLSPVTLHIYPTNKCNQRCSFCEMKKENLSHPDELPRRIFSKLIKDAELMKVKAINVVGGGEPALYPYIEVLAETTMPTFVTTNGTIFNKHFLGSFDHIRVSVNAARERTNLQLGMLEGAHRHTMNNVAEYAKKRGQCRLQTVGMAFALSHINWHDVYKVCWEANQLKLDFVHIRPVNYPFGDRTSDLVYRAWDKAQRLITRAQRDFPILIQASARRSYNDWHIPGFQRCLGTPLTAMVTASGDFIPCHYTDSNGEYIRFGNLHDKTFPEIWNSPEHHRAVAQLNNKRCVCCFWTDANKIIENMFLEDKCLIGLL